MKRVIMGVSTIFLLLSTLAFNGFVIVKDEAEEGFIIKMNVTYHNIGTENWTFTEEDRAIGLFMNNTWQTVHLINHSHPLENTTLDKDGNPIAILQFPNMQIEPGENISYTVTYHAFSEPRLFPNDIKEENSGTIEEIPEELKESYCGEGGPWLVNDMELQDLAYNITEGETKVLTIVKKFITWIKDNISYEIHQTPLYPNETYTERKGDCDDQAILFITLCRILKIPAYLQIGCIYLPTYFDDSKYWNGHLINVLKGIGWHGWAMVYVPPWQWLPVDLTFALGGYGDPLNAIKTAVVTLQKTIQYMNISQMDYVASARQARDFLEDNNFYIYTRDEMMEMPLTNHRNDTFETPFPWIVMGATAVVAVTTVGIFMFVWKRKKLKEIESNERASRNLVM